MQAQTEITTQTYIGRQRGFISTYYIHGREIKNIHFYTKNEGVKISTNRGWLNGENISYSDCNRVDGFYVKGEVTSHNKTLDINKRMLKGGNFTVNIDKQFSCDDKQCELYVEIDGEVTKLLNIEEETEINVYDHDLSAYKLIWKKACLEITTTKEGLTCKSYIKSLGENIKQDTSKYTKEIDKLKEVLQTNHVYLSNESDLIKIYNLFNLVQRDKALTETIKEKLEK